MYQFTSRPVWRNDFSRRGLKAVDRISWCLVANGCSVQHILGTGVLFTLGCVRTRAMIIRHIGAKKQEQTAHLHLDRVLAKQVGLVSRLI
jgi:hypothetical protein